LFQFSIGPIRLRSVLKSIKEHPKLELQIIVAVPAAYDYFFANLRNSRPHSWLLSLPWYIRARVLGFLGSKKVLQNDFLASKLIEDGFNVNGYVPMFIDGGVSDTMAKSVGVGIPRIVEEMKRLKPDVVFVNADRFEMMAVALSASYMNIPIAHNEGGDVSGTIDESIRHAITKLSHIHFTSTEQSRKRVIQMGENPERVFAVGSPAIDAVKNLDLSIKKNIFPGLDISKPFLLTLLHPVATASAEENSFMANNLISTLKDLKMQTVLLGSNTDAGSDEVGKAIRNWIQNENPNYIFFTKHLHPDDFYRYLNASACAVGNSSSFIREGAYFGTPVVLIGSRQNKRERTENILESGENCENIKLTIANQIRSGRFQKSFLFGEGNSSERISDVLSNINLTVQKSFQDLQ
jgi:UDP-hydrolysing UDP-N-acetyl-D-glucosamine 2-epimerase